MATIKDVLNKANGTFVTVTFIKKDGTIRVLNGRTGVKKYVVGGGKPSPDNIIKIFDVSAIGYRSFDVSRVLSIKARKNVYTFGGGVVNAEDN